MKNLTLASFVIYIITGYCLFLIFGCSTYQEALNKIPCAEFESFSFSQGGMIQNSMKITASGAKKSEGHIEFQSLSIHEANPFFVIDADLKGYKRGFDSKECEQWKKLIQRE